MASDDEELAFAEEIDPKLAKILAEIRDYCETMPPEEALDLIEKCRMVVSVCRDIGRLDDGADDQPGSGSLEQGGSAEEQ
ncbi:hypothetical protein [Streptomyces coeruleorubidus]|nr:hypothetical protein [Streptomyces coeruleorubidus]GGT48775.1 hypothetical protein GCM10010256_01200 [Streptomyces coeruleorubidus]